jgi:endoglucanase
MTVSNATWNGNLGTGATTSTGFQGTFSGSSLPTPTNFTFNGATCTS